MQVNQITMMLYQKIEENTMLANKLEQQAQVQAPQLTIQQLLTLASSINSLGVATNAPSNC
jgi:hypothetical protein